MFTISRMIIVSLFIAVFLSAGVLQAEDKEARYNFRAQPSGMGIVKRAPMRVEKQSLRLLPRVIDVGKLFKTYNREDDNDAATDKEDANGEEIRFNLKDQVTILIAPVGTRWEPNAKGNSFSFTFPGSSNSTIVFDATPGGGGGGDIPVGNICECDMYNHLDADDAIEVKEDGGLVIIAPSQIDGKTVCNKITGSDGKDLLVGGNFNDHFFGGRGYDTIIGGHCSDTLYADDSDDFQDFNPGEGDAVKPESEWVD